MRILLDTTYLLSLIGISVNNIPHDLLLKFIDDGYEVYISSISLFELIAKGARYSSRGGYVKRGGRDYDYRLLLKLCEVSHREEITEA